MEIIGEVSNRRFNLQLYHFLNRRLFTIPDCILCRNKIQPELFSMWRISMNIEQQLTSHKFNFQIIFIAHNYLLHRKSEWRLRFSGRCSTLDSFRFSLFYSSSFSVFFFLFFQHIYSYTYWTMWVKACTISIYTFYRAENVPFCVES